MIFSIKEYAEWESPFVMLRKVAVIGAAFQDEKLSALMTWISCKRDPS